jgi:hypothetical protein
MVSILKRWRRDLIVGGLASVLTVAVLAPLCWAELHKQREQGEFAERLALHAVRLAQQDAEQARDQAKRALVDQAADLLGNLGGPEKGEAAALRVATDAVAPEVPQGAYLLIDKKAATYAIGDIIVFRVGDNNFLGRVVAVDKDANLLTIGRNDEANRKVAFDSVLGRGVLNTR